MSEFVDKVVVVTGSGTAGLEFICEGKQAILAGSAAYTDDKITPYYAQNKEQYFKIPNKPESLNKIKTIYDFQNCSEVGGLIRAGVNVFSPKEKKREDIYIYIYI